MSIPQSSLLNTARTYVNEALNESWEIFNDLKNSLSYESCKVNALSVKVYCANALSCFDKMSIHHKVFTVAAAILVGIGIGYQTPRIFIASFAYFHQCKKESMLRSLTKASAIAALSIPVLAIAHVCAVGATFVYLCNKENSNQQTQMQMQAPAQPAR